MSRVHTPPQTVGPFFHLGLGRLDNAKLAPDGTPPADVVTVHGKLFDADLNPVPDAQLEIWQANAEGRHVAHRPDGETIGARHFSGFGRIPTNAQGEFHFTTIRPGVVAGPDGIPQAPHIVVLIFMRGLLKHLATRIYFSGDSRNDADPILRIVPADRRGTLLALSQTSASDTYEWNVLLQGENETVFFDL